MTYPNQSYDPTPRPTGADPATAGPPPSAGYTPSHLESMTPPSGPTWSAPTQTGADSSSDPDSTLAGRRDSGDDRSMGDRASEAADAGKQAASDVAATAKDQARDVAAEAVNQARDVVGQAKCQLRDQLQSQHGNLIGNLRQLGDELSRMSNSEDEPSLAADVVGQAGGHARTVASWLETRQPEDVLDELRSFARRRPGPFLLGALAAGVAAGRLTRGAVDVHRDGSSSASPPSVPDTTDPTPGPLPPSTNGYESGAYGAEVADPVGSATETRDGARR